MASSNPITLSDYALMSNSPIVQKISYSLIQNGSVLADLPMKQYKSMVANGVRFLGSGLVSVTSRSLNEDPASGRSVPTPFQEQAYILSKNFDVDKILLDDVNSIQDPWTVEIGAYLKALTYGVNDRFINNDHVTAGGDAKSIVGLRYRLDNPGDYSIPAEMKLDAGVDLSGTISVTNANKMIEVIDQLLQNMGDSEGNGVVLYCNDILRRKLNTSVRTLGAGAGFATTTDAFGRQITTYRGAKITSLGRKADQTTPIISQTETAAGAQTGGTYTSIYGVKYSLDGDGLYGWEFRSMEEAISPARILDNGTQWRMTFDYPVGVFQENVRAVGRIFDVKVA